MADVTIKVTGLAELEKALNELPEKYAKPALRTASRKSAAIVQRAAREKAPLYVGPNKKGLISGFLVSQIQIFTRVFSEGVYGSSIITKIGIGKAFYGKFLEFGTKNIQRHPFLTPAFEENVQSMIDTFKTELSHAIASVRVKLSRVD